MEILLVEETHQEERDVVRETVKTLCDRWKRKASQSGQYQGESQKNQQAQWEGLGRAQALNKAASWLSRCTGPWYNLATQVHELLVSLQILQADECEEFGLTGEAKQVRVVPLDRRYLEQEYKACGRVKGYARVEQDLRALLQHCLSIRQDEDTACLQDVPA